MFVLAHLSDIHLGPLPFPRPAELFSKRGLGLLNWLRKRHRIHRPEILAQIVADLQSRSPDHVAITGDLVNLSLSSEFAPAFAWLGRLGPPRRVTVVPGNHDRYVQAAAHFADEHWGEYMRGDAGESFPFVRRRGPLALVGLSTSLPTLPLAATGHLHGDQLSRLPGILEQLEREGLFRVVLMHHPPFEGAHRFRRLTDVAAVLDVLRRSGAELVLHGHHHETALTWLDGPRSAIPCVGVPSASGAQGHHDEPAAYNLYVIAGEPGGWRCIATTRGFAQKGTKIREIRRFALSATAASAPR